MPRVIRFPPAGPSPSPDDVRYAKAWASFAADDATVSARAGLEARVMQAAQAALIEKRRADRHRRRQHWIGGLTALAASLVAAAAWFSGTPTPQAGITPATTTLGEPARAVAGAVAGSTAGAGSRHWSAPVPMTNVEAGRVLLDGGPRRLAARPLLDAADTGLVRAAIVPRAKSFLAPVVIPAPIPLRASNTPAPSAQPDAEAAPEPLGVAAPPAAPAAPEVWTSRSFQHVFDPTSAQHPPTPPAPKEEPPPPPPKN